MNLKIVALFPDHLNLNGDQANLMVMQKRLAWRGINSQIVSVQKGASLPSDSDFIFLGHGSIAAWNDIADDLERLLPSLKSATKAGCAFMAVASGHEKLIQLGLFSGAVEPIERVSKFEIAELGELRVLGYLNSGTNAPVLQLHKLLLGTQLHGPVFAKNPALVDKFISEILSGKGLDMRDFADDSRISRVDELAGSVWQLEEELASE